MEVLEKGDVVLCYAVNHVSREKKNKAAMLHMREAGGHTVCTGGSQCESLKLSIIGISIVQYRTHWQQRKVNEKETFCVGGNVVPRPLVFSSSHPYVVKNNVQLGNEA